MARILAVGTHPEVMPVIERLLRSQDGWEPVVVFGAPEALAALQTIKHIDVVLLGAGLSSKEEADLHSAASALSPKVPVVAHYGGGSGLLFAEIWGALGTHGDYL